MNTAGTKKKVEEKVKERENRVPAGEGDYYRLHAPLLVSLLYIEPNAPVRRLATQCIFSFSSQPAVKTRDKLGIQWQTKCRQKRGHEVDAFRYIKTTLLPLPEREDLLVRRIMCATLGC